VRRIVRDDPERPDPGFAELYASLPDAADPEPWLGWCRAASGPVLYLGVGAGRLAVPLAAAGVELVGVDAHPAMLAHLRARLPEAELVPARIEDLRLDRRFGLVLGPSGVLGTAERLAAAARHAGGLVAMELMNPHWLLAGGHAGVRVLCAAAGRAEIEVDYPGDWTQRAEVELRWPEDVERLLASAGLRLELMRGRDADGDLADSETYFVLARARPTASRTPGATSSAKRRTWVSTSSGLGKST
jgi:SAM-dependent methyltransferase